MRPAGRVILSIAVLGSALAAAPAGADEAAPASPSNQELLQRIEQLEKANQQQAAKIDELQAKASEDWLTEQRAGEIRAIVTDVLADADSRTSLMSTGMTAGWDDGFFLASTDDRFRLEIEGLIQIRFIWNYHDQVDNNRYGFENTRTRLTFRGHVFGPDLTYLVRGGYSRDGGGGTTNSNGEIRGGTMQLYDAWVRGAMNNEWSVRVGQFKLPFNREELVAAQYQLAIERSLVNESMNIGRSQGIELQYMGDVLKWNLAFSDGGDDDLGQSGTLAGTSPANTPWSDQDTEFALTTRIETLLAGNWKQFEQFTSPMGGDFGMLLGGAAHGQMGEFGTGFFGQRDENNWFALTADLSIEWGGATAFGSIIYHYVDNATFGIFDVYGAMAQAGLYLTPKTEIYGRFEFGGLDGPIVQFSKLYLATIGVNYYIQGQDVKWTTDIAWGISQVEAIWAADIAGYRTDGNGIDGQVVFRTQLQLMF